MILSYLLQHVPRMTDPLYEVIIIGGGPAGLFAGIVCARNGLRTLLLEKQSYPIDKPCGEGIMPAGVEHLRKLGAATFIEAGQHRLFSGIRYISCSGYRAEARFAEGPGWGIERVVFSSALYERARVLPNLEIREGVQPESDTSGTSEVRLGKQVLRPHLLIGADGLRSRIRRLGGLEGPSSKLRRWGVRQHFHCPPWSDFVEIYWGPGLEAYVTPVSGSGVNVNFLWDAKRFKPRQGGTKLVSSLLSEFPELHQRLNKAETWDKALAVGPLHRLTLGVAKYKFLLIGDAAGFFDPITGEGISLAAKQALLLEQLVVPALKRTPTSLGDSLAQYARACRGIYRPYIAMTRVVLLLRLRPALTDRVIQLLHIFPGMFQRLLSVNMRN